MYMLYYFYPYLSLACILLKNGRPSQSDPESLATTRSRLCFRFRQAAKCHTGSTSTCGSTDEEGIADISRPRRGGAAIT